MLSGWLTFTSVFAATFLRFNFLVKMDTLARSSLFCFSSSELRWDCCVASVTLNSLWQQRMPFTLFLRILAPSTFLHSSTDQVLSGWISYFCVSFCLTFSVTIRSICSPNSVLNSLSDHRGVARPLFSVVGISLAFLLTILQVSSVPHKQNKHFSDQQRVHLFFNT